jgi:ABC-type transport system involved in multi-copper enzyme maturation permease subunit
MSRMSSWRISLGPVFAYERIAASRRWQEHALRSLFLVALLAILSWVWVEASHFAHISQQRRLAIVAGDIFLGVSVTQLALVVLAAPALSAGAICVDRSRGTLAHLLVTELSSTEIVLGKLMARLLPVLAGLACTLPIVELLTLLGGVDPGAFLSSFVVAMSVTVLGCAVATFFSLWVRKSFDALLMTYMCLGLWLVARLVLEFLARLTGWLWIVPSKTIDPFYIATAPYLRPGGLGIDDYVWFSGVTGSISLFFIAVTTLAIRRVCTRDGADKLRRGSPEAQRGNILRRLHRVLPWLETSLDGNPVVWREWHRSRPSRLRRMLLWLSISVVTSLNVFAILWADREIASIVNGAQVAIGLLVLSGSSATSLAEERARGSLDLLLCTPLSTWQIVSGKWLGALRAVPLLMILPTLLAGTLAFISDRGWVAASCYMLVYLGCASGAASGLGLLMATWFSRVGRAAAAAVVVHIGVTGATLLYAAAILNAGFDKLAMASPFYWASQVTYNYGTDHKEVPGTGTVFWTGVALALGVALLDRAVADFDRRLGRAESETARVARPSRAARIVFVAYLASTPLFFLTFAWNPAQNLALQFTFGSVISAGIAGSSCWVGRGGPGEAIRGLSSRARRRVILVKWAGAWRYGWALVAVSLLIMYLMSTPYESLWKEYLFVIGYMLVVHAAAISLGVAVFAWSPRRLAPAFVAALHWTLVIVPWFATPEPSASVPEGLLLWSPVQVIDRLSCAIFWPTLAPPVGFQWVGCWIFFYMAVAVALVVAACETRRIEQDPGHRRGESASRISANDCL